MSPGDIFGKFMYNPILIERCVYSRPFWKKWLATLGFERYKLSKKEFDEWYFRDITK